MLRKLIAGLCLAALLACPADALTGERWVLLSGNVLWTPLNLGSALVAWWDASDTAHIVLSVSNVTSWTDKVSGIVALQATGAAQPTYSATARNGKPGVTFSGAQNLAFGTSAVLPTGTATSMIATEAFANTSASAAASFSYGTFATAQLRAIQKNTSNVAVVTDFGTDVTNGAWSNSDMFIEALYSSATITGWTDGNATIGPSAAGFNTTGTTGMIGAANGGNNFAGVVQQAFVLINPSTCQRQKLESFVSYYVGRNGANLPASNPYRNGPPLVGGGC